MAGLPERVVGAYWTYWSNPPGFGALDSHYNTQFLFHCEPVGGPPGSTGAVQWMGPTSAAFVNELQAWRAKGNCAILTIGGASANVGFGSRSRAEAFVASFQGIYNTLGGLDGCDWNNYEGNEVPDTEDMIWIGQRLKQIYGPSFVITSPPAPWRDTDFTHCRALIDAGALDWVAPQYYDGPGLEIPSYIVERTGLWIDRMGGDPSKVGIGFGVKEGVANYTSLQGAKEAWADAAVLYPGLKGAFDWEVAYDAQHNWGFARDVGSMVLATATGGGGGGTPPPTGGGGGGSTDCTDCEYTVVAGDTLSAIGTKTGCPWPEIAELNGIVAPNYIIEVGQVLELPCAEQPTEPPPTEPPPTEPPPTEPDCPDCPDTDLSDVKAAFEVALAQYLELGASLAELWKQIGAHDGGNAAE
jgi:LysM domain